MTFRQIVAVLLTSAGLLLAVGCERADNQMLSSEVDEPNYRQGQQLVKQGRSQEALSAYLKVIAKRGESAPESHLEAGLLYLEEVKDPLAAIYHFRKYLELQPNSRQAGYVRGRIDVAKREFARTLPAQPLENQAERLDMFDQVDRLQRENDQMKAELSALRGGVSTPPTRTRSTVREPAPQSYPRIDPPDTRSFVSRTEDDGLSPISRAPDVPMDSPGGAAAVQATPTQPPVRALPTKPTSPAASRRHVVVKGDTLFSLAQRYYGNRSRWRDIYAANSDVLPSENSLRIGMEIRIP